MEWEQVRKKYPEKLVVFKILREHKEEQKLLVDELIVIQVFNINNLNNAFNYYRQVKHKYNNNEISLADTRNKELSYNVKYIVSVLKKD